MQHKKYPTSEKHFAYLLLVLTRAVQTNNVPLFAIFMLNYSIYFPVYVSIF